MPSLVFLQAPETSPLLPEKKQELFKCLSKQASIACAGGCCLAGLALLFFPFLLAEFC